MITQKVIFTKEECQYILEQASSWVKNVGYLETGFKEANYDRVNEESYIKTDKIKAILVKKLSEFNVIDIPEEFKILKYSKGGYFGKHKDSGWNFPDRKITIIIQLSEDSSYKGGQMIVENTEFEKKIGNTIVFDASSYHELKVVEEGKRYVAVLWIGSKHLLKTSII
jgi:predicted 2-oxoglutarate/Fe(II)-dependent dioxygenase YbiX